MLLLAGSEDGFSGGEECSCDGFARNGLDRDPVNFDIYRREILSWPQNGMKVNAHPDSLLPFPCLQMGHS